MIVVLSEVVLSEEASGDTFSGIGVNLDKPADDSVDDEDKNDVMPPIEARQSAVDVDMSEEVAEGSQPNASYEPVVFHRVVTADEGVAVEVDAVAFPCGVAERQAGKSNVAVGVSAYQAEAHVKESFVVTSLTNFMAAGVSMTGEQLNDESRHFKEAVDEGTTDDTAPVLSDESVDRGMPFGFMVVPVPVGRSAGDAEVDWIE